MSLDDRDWYRDELRNKEEGKAVRPRAVRATSPKGPALMRFENGELRLTEKPRGGWGVWVSAAMVVVMLVLAVVAWKYSKPRSLASSAAAASQPQRASAR